MTPSITHRVPWFALSVPVLVLVVFFAVPNALLLSTSFLRSEAQVLTSELTLENYAFFLSRPGYLAALLRTFAIGIAVGIIDVALAYPVAYLIVRRGGRFSGVLLALAMAPLLASVVVRTYGWYVILDRQGVLNELLQAAGLVSQPIAFLPSTGAIVIGLAHALLPYSILTIMGSLKNVDPSLERAAMSLGAGRARTFLTVLLPLTLPGAASGMLLAFSIAISAYATPAVLGGPGTATLATLMYTFVMSILDWSVGSTIAAILLVTSLVVVFVASRLGSRQASL